ncbi:MAG: hypothetical protein ACE5I1_27140, partial [bacterium]
MKKFITIYLLLPILLFLLIQCSNIADIQKSIPGKIPLVGMKLDKDSQLTTNLKDAVTEIPLLDDFDPESTREMIQLPRGENGEFLVQDPGVYELVAQSFCLRAGKHGPGEGDGYLYAPLKGSRAHIIHKILRNAYRHPGIPQQDIQVLLWAIIARTKISDMSRDKKITAARLLAAKDIYELNGGALGLIPQSVFDKATNNLPPLLRQTLEAEAQLRQMLSQANTTFEDLERVAVLIGDPAPGAGSRDVPRGRWSYHPEGYFVRYIPSGYTKTKIQLAVPEIFHIERDDLGRITSIADANNNRIETDYDDTIEPLTVTEAPKVRGYAFREIRLIHPDPVTGEVLSVKWNDVGWTFVGASFNNAGSKDSYNSWPGIDLGSKIKSGGSQTEPFSNVMFASLDLSPGYFGFPFQQSEGWANEPGKRYKKWKSRYDRGKKYYDQGKKYYDRWRDSQRPPSWEDIEKVTDIKHYEDGLEAAKNFDMSAKAEWIDEHLNLVSRAWLY